MIAISSNGIISEIENDKHHAPFRLQYSENAILRIVLGKQIFFPCGDNWIPDAHS